MESTVLGKRERALNVLGQCHFLTALLSDGNPGPKSYVSFPPPYIADFSHDDQRLTSLIYSIANCYFCWDNVNCSAMLIESSNRLRILVGTDQRKQPASLLGLPFSQSSPVGQADLGVLGIDDQKGWKNTRLLPPPLDEKSLLLYSLESKVLGQTSDSLPTSITQQSFYYCLCLSCQLTSA